METKYLTISNAIGSKFYVKNVAFRLPLDDYFIKDVDAMVKRYCKKNNLNPKNVRYNWTHIDGEDVVTKFVPE